MTLRRWLFSCSNLYSQNCSLLYFHFYPILIFTSQKIFLNLTLTYCKNLTYINLTSHPHLESHHYPNISHSTITTSYHINRHYSPYPSYLYPSLSYPPPSPTVPWGESKPDGERRTAIEEGQPPGWGSLQGGDEEEGGHKSQAYKIW